MSDVRWQKWAVVVALALAVVAVLALKRPPAPVDGGSGAAARESAAPAVASTRAPAVSPSPRALPRLLDLGADKCVACKMMVPVLADLRKAHAGRLTVDFIDVWKDPDAARRHKVETIPTQIFFGPDGRELYRHAGFIGRDEIVKKFGELGVGL